MSKSPIATDAVVPQKRTSNVSNNSYTREDDTFSIKETNSFSTNDTEYSTRRNQSGATGKTIQVQSVQHDHTNMPNRTSKVASVLQNLKIVRSEQACPPIHLDEVQENRSKVKLLGKLRLRRTSVDEAATEADRNGDDPALALQRIDVQPEVTTSMTESTVQQQAPRSTEYTPPQASSLSAALSVAANEKKRSEKPSRRQRGREIGKRFGKGLVRNMCDSIYGPLCPDWAIGELKNPHSKFMMTPMAQLRPDYVNGNECCGRLKNKHNHFCEVKKMQLKEKRRNSPSAWSFLWDWRDDEKAKEKGKARDDSYTANHEGSVASDADVTRFGHQ